MNSSYLCRPYLLVVDARIPLPAGLVSADEFGTALEHECTCHTAVWDWQVCQHNLDVVRVVGVENTLYCCLIMSGLHVMYKFIGWKSTKTHHHHHHHHQHEFSVGWWAVHPMVTRRRMEERQSGNSDFCSFSLWWLHWTVRIDRKSSQQHLPMRSSQRFWHAKFHLLYIIYSPKSYNSLEHL